MGSIGRKIRITGTVQGVGFRPWVYRLAREEGVRGTVRNDATGVTIEAFGPEEAVGCLLDGLRGDPPPAARIESLLEREIEWRQEASFSIVGSDAADELRVSIPPDLALCADCGLEVADPDDRRHRYPFTNCTNCGPRFTITLDLPYDRPSTTMASFEMCPDCRSEYEDPGDRRFHAQPNACPVCGPRVVLWARAEGGEGSGAAGAQAGGELGAAGGEAGSTGPGVREVERDDQALRGAAAALARGEIVAVKGLGGFHLMVDARDGEAVARLRRRKARYDKPLALMVRDVEAARELCEVPEAAERLLTSIEAPIVLLRRRRGGAGDGPTEAGGSVSADAARDAGAGSIADEVAPGHPDLGLMLPYTPLHHLLLDEIDFPVVATSGNLSDEPICIDNLEAIERLGKIADLFLVHDRPIARHADDSVAWLVEGAPALLRRARGYAPAPVRLRSEAPTFLAVGGHLKNTVALNLGRNVLISQHIGDMETPQARHAFERVIADLLRMCEADPVAVVHDLHPDYPSTTWAQSATKTSDRLRFSPPESGDENSDRILFPPILADRGEDSKADHAIARLADLPRIAVQHHHAHLASCLTENGIHGRALGVTWDGTGYGTDGSVWGGEFLLGDASGFERVAHLRPFRLPGGDAAVKSPRKVALALLWEVLGEDLWNRTEIPMVAALERTERNLLQRMLASGLRSPITTSAGRLFDGIAGIAGLRQEISYEGQAAMELEFVSCHCFDEAYPVGIGGEGVVEIDWRPLVEAALADWSTGRGADIIGARFHNALVETIVEVAQRVGEARVALSGGCFQNRRLTESCARRLREAGHEVLLHRRVPANDGGISLGQVAVAAAGWRPSTL